MAPFYRGYNPSFNLDSDDIEAIQVEHENNYYPSYTIKFDHVINNKFFFGHLTRLCMVLAAREKDQTTTKTVQARDRVKRQQRKNLRAQRAATLNCAQTLK